MRGQMDNIIRQNRGFFLFESIIFIIAGILGIALPQVLTFSIELIVGALFLASGVVQVVRTFKAWGAPGYLYSLLTAIASTALGVLLLAYPLSGVFTLTVLLAIYFLIDGIATILLGLRIRHFARWGWLVFSGVVSVILSFLIWNNLPSSSVWVIGLLVGINLLMFGFSLLFFTLGTRK